MGTSIANASSVTHLANNNVSTVSCLSTEVESPPSTTNAIQATTASISLATVPTENGIITEDPWIKRGQNQFINTTAGETVTAVSERGSLTTNIGRG